MVYNKFERDCDARDIFKQKFLNSSLFTNYQIYFTFTEPVLFWAIPGLLITVMNFYVLFKIFKSNQIITDKFSVGRKYGKMFTVSKSKNSLKNAENELTRLNDNYYLTDENNNTICITTEMKSSVSMNQIRRPSTFSLSLTANNIIEMRKHSSTSLKSIEQIKTTVNQISHYITIMIVGFYFIFSTIPFGIMLSFQNNLTLKLNYHLHTKQDYLNDPLWVSYGHLREWVFVTKLFFISNHCLNFFLYFFFNELFRQTLYDLFKSCTK
jgi:hypothetical protein